MSSNEIQIKNPWQKLENKIVYDNPWITVREDKVINPAGGEGIYGVVNFKSTAVGIIPLDNTGHTWIVGQYRYPLEEYSWEIPMGGATGDILDGASRELKEETGITAARWHELMKIHTSNSVTNEVGYVFVATDLTLGQWEPEDTEDLTIQRIPFTKAVDMVLNNSITDGISIAGILRLDIALRSGELTAHNQ